MTGVVFLLRMSEVTATSVRGVKCWVRKEALCFLVVLVPNDVASSEIPLELRAMFDNVGTVMLLRAVAAGFPDDLRATVDDEVVSLPGLVELERPVRRLLASLRMALLAPPAFDRKIGTVYPKVDSLTLRQ